MRTITNITADIFYAPAESIVLTDLIDDVIASLNANVQYGSRPVVIQVQADSSLPPIRANRRRLYSCLHTIMIEFQNTTPSNPGHIQLTAKPGAIEMTMQPLEIVNTDHGEMLTLLLADNGGQTITLVDKMLYFVLESEQADL